MQEEQFFKHAKTMQALTLTDARRKRAREEVDVQHALLEQDGIYKIIFLYYNYLVQFRIAMENDMKLLSEAMLRFLSVPMVSEALAQEQKATIADLLTYKSITPTPATSMPPTRQETAKPKQEQGTQTPSEWTQPPQTTNLLLDLFKYDDKIACFIAAHNVESNHGQ